jgi:hypothetical protein
MLSKGLSHTLNCTVPGRGISGLLRGWFSPLLVAYSCTLMRYFLDSPRGQEVTASFHDRDAPPSWGGAWGRGGTPRGRPGALDLNGGRGSSPRVPEGCAIS